jgi:hypothetical protein
MTLYSNDNGMTACIDHGGSYLQSEYKHAPDRRVYRTPLDRWERIDPDYAAEFAAIVGRPPACEFC